MADEQVEVCPYCTGQDGNHIDYCPKLREPVAVDPGDTEAWASVDLNQLNVKQLVALGVAVRDVLKMRTRAYNAYKKSADDFLETIGMHLKVHGDNMGVNSFSTPFGTAYRNTKESYRVADWPSFLDFIKETENWQCLEKRAAKLATKEQHKHLGHVPPGIDYIAEEVFVLRRPNERGSSDE